MKLVFSLLFLAILSTSVLSQVPIPTRPDGYALGTGPATSPVVVDAFFDLLCPDSKAAWPVVKSVIAAYPENLYFLLHTFPLPYHTNAFIANQGLHVIDHATSHNRTALLAYTDLLFQTQAAFYNAPTMNQTINQVISNLATTVEQSGILSAKAYTAGIANSDINEETRISWKYTCSRAVVGTPTFFLNGVYISADSSWKVADWKSVIDPIIRANSRTLLQHELTHSAVLSSPLAQNTTCPSTSKYCEYSPGKTECCIIGETCIPNVGCRCATAKCAASRK